MVASAPLVISTVAERSGEISPSDGTGGITDGRSLDSEYHGSGSCLSPIAACSSARDDGVGGQPYRHVKKRSVAGAPSTTAVTDSLDFQVANAPLQIQFA